MPLLSLALLALLVGALPWLLRPRFLPSIPHRPAVPLFGNALALLAHMRKGQILSDFLLNEVSRPLGPLAQFLTSAFSPMVVVADLKLAEYILASKDWVKGELARAVFAGLGPYGMLALPTNAMLRLHRRALAPTMTPAFLSIAGDIFGAHTSALIRLWQRRLASTPSDARGAVFFDHEGDIKDLTTDAISQITFGESFGQLGGKLMAMEAGDALVDGAHRGTKVAQHMSTLFSTLSSGLCPRLRHWIKRQAPSYRRAYRGLHAYVDGQVADARRHIAGGGEVAEIRSVIDMVIAKEGEAGEGAFLPRLELIDELGTFLITGEETTATAFCWVIKFLSEHSEVQERLFEELQPAMPSPDERPIGHREVSGKLPYLEAVVHEVLRLGSVVRASPRQATRDTFLVHPVTQEVIAIPKGTNAIVMIGESCMVQSPDPKVGWAHDPLAFNPVRWLDDEGRFSPNRGPSMPFAQGPRGCFGLKMALTFIRIFTAQLALSFHLARLPTCLHEDKCKAFITRRPVRNFVGLRERKDRRDSSGDEGYFSRGRSFAQDSSSP